MKKDTEELYALKTIRKLFVIEKKQFDQVRREKEILHEASHPFLVGLKCAFQTPDKLFLLMPFVQGGDLFMHLKKRKRFGELEVRFFAAQIILGLTFLHEKSIIYQDLKPENILLDSNGYIKLADFGAAKYGYQTKSYKTFIGTADYIAPEVLKKLPYNKAVDWWSLGILMFELLYGKPPFFQQNPKATFRHI
jgi:serine/threonine protein kinase